MKKVYAILSALLIGAQVSGAEEVKTVAPIDVVKKLYTDHLANRGPLAGGEESRSESKIFSEALNKVFMAGNWGFDPLIFGQDMELGEISYQEIDRDAENAWVRVSFKNFGEPVRLVVAMKKGKQGYFIENIVEPKTGIDLLNDLSTGEP